VLVEAQGGALGCTARQQPHQLLQALGTPAAQQKPAACVLPLSKPRYQRCSSRPLPALG
jgi:hypothetical protein